MFAGIPTFFMILMFLVFGAACFSWGMLFGKHNPNKVAALDTAVNKVADEAKAAADETKAALDKINQEAKAKVDALLNKKAGQGQ